jgi:hypothetical protein
MIAGLRRVAGCVRDKVGRAVPQILRNVARERPAGLEAAPAAQGGSLMSGARGTGDRDPYPKDVLSLVLSNLTVAAAVVYTSGWVYLRYYYEYFGVDLSILEFSWNETLVYSISVLSYIVHSLLSWQTALWLAVFIIAALAVRRGLPAVERLAVAAWGSFVWRSLLIVVLIGLLSAYVFVMAKRAGLENAFNAWKAPQLATELVFAEACKPSPILKFDNETRSLRLLKSTPKLYILFKRHLEPQHAGGVMDIRLYRVPAACVSHSFTGIRRRGAS